MKSILAIISFCAFACNAQQLNAYFLKDTFELGDAYLFKSSLAWFSEDESNTYLHFKSVKDEEKSHDFRKWNATGELMVPVKVLSDTSFIIEVKWKGWQAKEKECSYIGNLSLPALYPKIKFTAQCGESDDIPLIPDLTGTQLNCLDTTTRDLRMYEGTIYNAEILDLGGEVFLHLKMLDNDKDSIVTEFYYTREQRALHPEAEFYLNKKIRFLYHIYEIPNNYNSGFCFEIVE